MKAVLYGSGSAASSYLKHKGDDNFNIQYIVDKNAENWGKFINCYEVKSPELLLNNEYFVIITSMYVTDITKYLVGNIGIEPSRIIYPTKQKLKDSYKAFSDEKTFEYANCVFVEFLEILEEYKVIYFVDYGTLLGIVRDGAILKWDEDIDFKIYHDEKTTLIDIINSIKKDGWIVQEHYNGITINVTSDKIKTFTIDFEIICETKISYTSEEYEFPKRYFENYELIYWKGMDIKVPSYYIEYLAYLYGEDWGIPKSNFSFADYNLLEV